MVRDITMLAEAAAYFHSQAGLARMLHALVHNYGKLGRLGGSVVLSAVSSEERAALEGFFRKRLPEGDLRILARDFATALAQTRFGEWEPLDILAAWQGTPLASRQQVREQAEAQWHTALAKLMRAHPQPYCQAWLRAAWKREFGTRRVQNNFRRDKCFAENMTLALQALGNLPQEYQRLPVFARAICGNPHALDMVTVVGKLFVEGLRYTRMAERNLDHDPLAVTEELSAVEELNELLFHFWLLRDDMLNFATCIGLTAYDLQGEIAYWRSAAVAGAPLNLPLREVVRAARISSVAEGADFEVLIVENSGVFSALLDEINAGAAWLGKPLVCLHGQLKLTSWALLDRLVQSGAWLRYAGDFDPEGLQIAQKILLRYSGKASLWRMTVADYQAAELSKRLDASRIAKLGSIVVPELLPLAQAISQTSLAAYQEGLIGQLASDVTGIAGR